MKYRLSRITFRLTRAITVSLLIIALQSCLLTSPFHGQEFPQKTSNIPIQAWTSMKNQSVKLECAQSGRFGPAPLGGSIDWQFVKNIAVGQTPAIDPKRFKIFSASSDTALPDSCWRTVNTSAGLRHYTALRTTQTNYLGKPVYEYMSFTAAGLECLGREVGKAQSWTGWSGNGCVNNYSGSSTPVPFVVIVAK